MITTNRRSPSSTRISKSAIEQATVTLNDLPEKPKENWSLQEAVNVMSEAITAALDRGYSYDEVASMLGNQGVDISASTLRYYLARSKRDEQLAGPEQKRRRRRKAQPNATGEESESSESEAPKRRRSTRAVENASGSKTTAQSSQEENNGHTANSDRNVAVADADESPDAAEGQSGRSPRRGKRSTSESGNKAPRRTRTKATSNG
ncbi:MAG TPA: hypothetical protein V6C78_28995 [Crinalium sp.]|jgi:hypothetical protein